MMAVDEMQIQKMKTTLLCSPLLVLACAFGQEPKETCIKDFDDCADSVSVVDGARTDKAVRPSLASWPQRRPEWIDNPPTEKQCDIMAKSLENKEFNDVLTGNVAESYTEDHQKVMDCRTARIDSDAKKYLVEPTGSEIEQRTTAPRDNSTLDFLEDSEWVENGSAQRTERSRTETTDKTGSSDGWIDLDGGPETPEYDDVQDVVDWENHQERMANDRQSNREVEKAERAEIREQVNSEKAASREEKESGFLSDFSKTLTDSVTKSRPIDSNGNQQGGNNQYTSEQCQKIILQIKAYQRTIDETKRLGPDTPYDIPARVAQLEYGMQTNISAYENGCK